MRITLYVRTDEVLIHTSSRCGAGGETERRKQSGQGGEETGHLPFHKLWIGLHRDDEKRGH